MAPGDNGIILAPGQVYMAPGVNGILAPGQVWLQVLTVQESLTSDVCLKRSFKSISYLGTLCDVCVWVCQREGSDRHVRTRGGGVYTNLNGFQQERIESSLALHLNIDNLQKKCFNFSQSHTASTCMFPGLPLHLSMCVCATGVLTTTSSPNVNLNRKGSVKTSTHCTDTYN